MSLPPPSMPGPETMLRRFALFGDIHAQADALEVALGFVASRRVDAILSVGDLADGDGDLDRTVALLTAHHVTCVAGNHDRWLLQGRGRDRRFAHRSEQLRPETLHFLRALPPTRTLETSFGVALLCHAVGAEDMPVLEPHTPAREILAMPAFAAVCAVDRVALMLCGHTHLRMVRTIGPITIVNAGTFASADAPGFVLVDTEACTVDAFAMNEDRTIETAGRSRFGLPGQDIWETSDCR